MPFYFTGSTLSLTMMVSKIYFMMRIKGDVFFSTYIGYLNSTHLVMTDCKKHEKISLFNQVLREISMVTMVTLIF